MSDDTIKEEQENINAANEYAKKQILNFITICPDLSNIKTGLLYLALKFSEYSKTTITKPNFKRSILSFCAILIAGHNEKFHYALSNMITEDAIKIAHKIEKLLRQNSTNEVYNLLENDETNLTIKELARLASNNMIYEVVRNEQVFYLPDYDNYDSASSYKEEHDIIYTISKPFPTKKKKGCFFWVCIVILLILISLGVQAGINSFYKTEIMQNYFKQKAYERYQKEKTNKYYN